jgi:transposase
METNFKNQRRHYDRDYASGQGSLSQSGDRYQISRPTGYTWIDRIEAEGLKAVEDRSRAPDRHPKRTPELVGERASCCEKSTAGEPPSCARS